MTSRTTTPMARVASALARVWADTQTASHRVAELQSLQIQPTRRAR